MEQYTKGEWKVITNGNSLLAIAIQGRNICSFEPLFLRGEKTSLYRQLGGEDEANAHLISASPDLYEACEEARQLILFLIPAGVIEMQRDRVADILDKAIAKAESKS